MAQVRIEFVNSDGGSNVIKDIISVQPLTVTGAVDSNAVPAGADLAIVRTLDDPIYVRPQTPADANVTQTSGFLITTDVGYEVFKVTEGQVISLID